MGPGRNSSYTKQDPAGVGDTLGVLKAFCAMGKQGLQLSVIGDRFAPYVPISEPVRGADEMPLSKGEWRLLEVETPVGRPAERRPNGWLR